MNNEQSEDEVLLDDCFECGNPMRIDENGIANHLSEDGDIDYEQDKDHVALAESLMTFRVRKPRVV